MALVPVAVPPARGHRRCSGRGRVRLRGLRAGFSPLHERNRGRGTPYRLSISCAHSGARHARTYGCPGVFCRAGGCARRARTNGCTGAFPYTHGCARHTRTYGCTGAFSCAHGCACHARTYDLTGVFSRGHAYSYTASVPHGYCHTASIPHTYSHTASAPHSYPHTDSVSHAHPRAADWAHQGQGRRVPGPGHFHRGSGQAIIYRGTDGSHLLRLENFNVTNGPDLRVLVSPHPDPRSRDDLNSRGYVELARLKGNRGNQNYPIPDNVDVSTVNSVIIYCSPFHVIFSVAPLRDADQ